MTRFSELVLFHLSCAALALLAGISTFAPSSSSSGPLLAIVGLAGLAWLSGRLGSDAPAQQPPRSGGLAASALAITFLLAPVPASATSMMISEIFTSPSGPDDGLEWIELYNGSGTAVDLSTHSLGWGGADYTWGTLQLSGTVAAGDTFVVGGPISNALNFNPVFDQVANFDGNLQGGALWVADGIALFDVPEASITATTVPMDTVVYGWTGAINLTGLMDSSGGVSLVDVTSYAANISFERGASGWVSQPAPTPGMVSDIVSTPEPGSASTLLCGLSVLVAWRRRTRLETGR